MGVEVNAARRLGTTGALLVSAALSTILQAIARRYSRGSAVASRAQFTSAEAGGKPACDRPPCTGNFFPRIIYPEDDPETADSQFVFFPPLQLPGSGRSRVIRRPEQASDNRGAARQADVRVLFWRSS